MHPSSSIKTTTSNLKPKPKPRHNPMTTQTKYLSSQDERKGLPSASAWNRYEECTGSWQLEQKATELGQVAHVSGPAAERGTRIHAWLAGAEVELSPEELLTAEFLAERAEEQRHRIFGDTSVTELKEKRLWLKVKGELAASGQFDRVQIGRAH